MSVDKFYLKEVCFNYFLDYLALELNFDNDYKFSDYYNQILTILCLCQFIIILTKIK